MKYIFNAALLALLINGCGPDEANPSYNCESYIAFRGDITQAVQAVNANNKEEAQALYQKLNTYAQGWPTSSKGTPHVIGIYCQVSGQNIFMEFSQDVKNTIVNSYERLKQSIEAMP